MSSRRRCPICRSKQWHKEPSSGVITCGEGHVLQDYRNETTERTEFGPHVMRKRTLKSDRKKKGKVSRADPKLYHGERARYLYLQCLQLLFRKQVTSLIKMWELPPEFETICRDVWAMHLSLLTSPPVEPDLQAQTQDESLFTKTKRADSDTDNSSEEENDASSSSTSTSDAEEDDEVMAELLRQNSETEGSDDEDKQKTVTASLTNRKKWWRKDDAPIANIAILVIACWHLRLPVIYMDFIKLIRMYSLPYLDPARLHLPESLTEHLTKHMKHALSPHHSPTTLALHSVTSQLANKLLMSYDVFIPEYNAASTLWRAVEHMVGNSVLYAMTKRLALIMDVPLTLHPALTPALARKKGNAPKLHKSDNCPPEMALVAIVVTTLKMIYGLDGKHRFSNDDWNPAFAMPSCASYLSRLRVMNERDRRRPETMFGFSSNMPILDYDDEEIDLYLDLCKRALVSVHVDTEGSGMVKEHFPIQEHPVQVSESRDGVADMPEVLPANNTADDPGDLMPGQNHAIYSAHDIMGLLPQGLQLVADRAASWVGVEADDLCAVIERLERRALRWWEKERRRARHEGTE